MTLHAARPLFTLACLLASPAIFAQTVNITVSGEIKEVVCTPTLSGPKVTGNTIALDPADTTDFPAQGATAKDTRITFAVTNCGKTQNNMWVHFNSTNTTTDGLMVPTTGPTDVVFEIIDVDSSGTPGSRVRAGGTAAATGPSGTQGTGAALSPISTWPNRSASKSYDIRYRRVSATPPQGGQISTAATYSVLYY